MPINNRQPHEQYEHGACANFTIRVCACTGGALGLALGISMLFIVPSTAGGPFTLPTMLLGTPLLGGAIGKKTGEKLVNSLSNTHDNVATSVYSFFECDTDYSSMRQLEHENNDGSNCDEERLGM